MRYRWFVREEDRTDEFGNPVSRAVHDEALQPKKTGYARGELLAIVMVAFILLYEWVTDDGPLIVICISFLVHEMRPLAPLFFGEHGKAVSNAMRGFSIALFVGALVWTFL